VNKYNGDVKGVFYVYIFKNVEVIFEEGKMLRILKDKKVVLDESSRCES